jgi:hypothetical protein
MGWDIFKPRARGRTVDPDDEFYLSIRNIETFAPKQHLEEREMYYYNYRQVAKYRKPLLSLLEQISERAGRGENVEVSVQTLFRKLKDFYDVNDKLSINEAIADYSLKVKLLKLFKMFYDDTTLTGTEVENYLKRLPKN